MKKNIILFFLFTLLFLGAGVWYFTYNKVKVNREEEAEIILEKIDEVKKLILVEGTFAEVYTYQQSENIFMDLFPVEKKVIVIIKAKTSIAYDLEKVDFKLDKELKQVIIQNIPDQEVIIEPKIEYYDIQQSKFYPLTAKDLSTINERAIKLIEKQIAVSVLPQTAENRLQEVLQQIIFTSENAGWEVIKN